MKFQRECKVAVGATSLMQHQIELLQIDSSQSLVAFAQRQPVRMRAQERSRPEPEVPEIISAGANRHFDIGRFAPFIGEVGMHHLAMRDFKQLEELAQAAEMADGAGACFIVCYFYMSRRPAPLTCRKLGKPASIFGR